ncbi:hypothetical protein [Noviherbaspirillum aerium]|uniref:hypothetical protein n=1 Tax=Noviherbaspirillum aerium TaxID=2588497 RepID=UPI00124DE69E|nr:hypothetical protein [Noviherbaspirillum aerium]
MHSVSLRETATNLVRRPVNGIVITASGRSIPQPPWIIPDDPATTAAYDQWLIDQSRIEAVDTGEEWMICRLAGLDAGFMDPSLRHLLSDFLFGLPEPEFEARHRTGSSPEE